MRSIQSRLATGLFISLIVLLVGQWLVVAFSIRSLSERYVVSQLIHATDILVAAVNITSGTPPSINSERIDPVYSKPFSGHYYMIRVGGQSFRSRSLWDQELSMPAVKIGELTSTREAGPQSQSLLVLSSSFKKQGETIQISVAEDIEQIENDINMFLLLHGTLSCLILALLITIQSRIVKKSLQPIETTRKEIQELESGAIDALNEDIPAELHPLVREINVRIKTVQQRLQRSRHATGNLAHALKGPLTLLNQLAQHEQIKANPELHDQLLLYTANIQDVINRELKRARLAGVGVAGRQSKLKPELEALIDSLRIIYRDKSLEITYQVMDQCASTLDREDLYEILGNLLDNACKWARNRVNIDIQCNTGLKIFIDDDGPGIPEQQRTRMLTRGQRLDEQTDGHGLGLAIVKDAVDQYGGSIQLLQSVTLGGLSVAINIPNV